VIRRRQERNAKKTSPRTLKLRIIDGKRCSPYPFPLPAEGAHGLGKRHQEAPQEDAEAQEKEAAEALPPQAEVIPRPSE
jgi:hypothetical protein